MHRAYGSGPSEKTGTTTGMDGVCQTENSDKETRPSSRQQERVEERSSVVQSREATRGNSLGAKRCVTFLL